MAQFTSPKTRQHHGERSGSDYADTGSCTATSWHWDRVTFYIIEMLTANTCDVQTHFGFDAITNELNSSGRHHLVVMNELLEIDFATNPFGVVAVNPAEPDPADDDDDPPDLPMTDAELADLQAGVKQPEPDPEKRSPWSRRTKHPSWADTPPGSAGSAAEDVEEIPAESNDIHVDSDDLTYSRF
eukprot:12075384-Heterocapsa_arctica.AAC.1